MGVAKAKTEICEALCRRNSQAWMAKQSPATTSPWYKSPAMTGHVQRGWATSSHARLNVKSRITPITSCQKMSFPDSTVFRACLV
ncbi:MAG: hypothetical protein KatS3mg105_1875 [Gemmatales bacterium]|nr:MAG: hypothetical protein KatS3mg105_1875 [Gemmatales bacterium]